MSKTVKVFSRCIGLNNKVAPMRFEYTPQHGLGNLSEAVNVDIEVTGGIKSRDGFSSLLSMEGIHSLWSEGDWCFFVYGTELYRMNASFVTSLQVAGLTGSAKMSYCVCGDRVFYSNGYQQGAIVEEAVEPWANVNPVSADGLREFSGPPLGTSLLYFAGRVWIADEKTLWFSEPYDPYSYNLAENYFIFDSEIKDLAQVVTGFYVMTRHCVDFVRGTEIDKMLRLDASNSIPVFNTFKVIDGHEYLANGNRADKINGKAVLWLSQEGILVGKDNGDVLNSTIASLDIPKPTQDGGAAMFVDGKYVVTSEVDNGD